MQTQNQKDARMQQQLSSGKSFTQQHYLSKQKEAQIVRIESRDNSISMNLPALMPNFQQLGDMNGSSSNDLYYQVKSFRCRNAFDNIKATDKIRLRSYITLRNAESLVEPLLKQSYVSDGDDDSMVIDISLSTFENGTEMTNANDLLQLLTNHIKNYIWNHQDNEDLNQKNIKNLFDYGYLTLVNQRCSFVYRYAANVSTGQVRYIDYPGIASLAGNPLDYWYIEYYNLSIEIPSDLSQDDQDRLSKMFGCEQIGSVSGQPVIEYIVDTVTSTSRIARLSPILNRAAVIIPSMDVDEGYYSSDCVCSPMYMYTLESIYIRSNLQSNLWSKSGKKTNVIAVIPLNGTQDSLSVEYQPTSVSGRTYNIKDSLNSMQHLQLQLTDSYGEPIAFLTNYELEIAIFFMPPDPSVLFQ